MVWLRPRILIELREFRRRVRFAIPSRIHDRNVVVPVAERLNGKPIASIGPTRVVVAGPKEPVY